MKNSILIKIFSIISLYFCAFLYGPEKFAEYYALIAIVALLSPVSTFGVHYLIGNEKVQNYSLNSAIETGLLVSFLVVLVVGLVAQGFREHDFHLAIFVALGIYLQGRINYLRLFSIQSNKLNAFLRCTLIFLVAGELAKILLSGYVNDYGLVIGYVITLFPGVLYRSNFNLSLKSLIKIIQDFKGKVFTRLFATFTQNSAIQIIPIVVTNVALDKGEAGKFLFSLAIVSMPATIFGKYINDIFYVEFGRNAGQAIFFVKKLILFYSVLALIGIPLVGYINSIGVVGFEVLSNEWVGVGKYVNVFLVLGFSQLMLNPLLQYFYQHHVAYTNAFNFLRLFSVLVLMYLFVGGWLSLEVLGLFYSFILMVLTLLVFMFFLRSSR